MNVRIVAKTLGDCAAGCPAQICGRDMHPHEYSLRKMLSAPEAAAYCGSSASTFAKLRLHGGGPHYVKLGRRVVYDPVDLDRWLASHRRASTSEGEAA
jgi:predicted DNA-binding transcriptional regulator AlpA